MKKLKYWILSIIVFGLSIISFSYWYTTHSRNSVSIVWNWSYEFSPWMCLGSSQSSTMYFSWENWNFFATNTIYCVDYTWYVINSNSIARTLYVYTWFNSSSCPACPDCPTCQECNNQCSLLVYDWILSSETFINTWWFSVYIPDNMYSYSNWTLNVIWWECTWNVNYSWNWSELFINEIQHPSAPIINITIPEEFDWSYTWNDETYDVSISWYNVDTQYIDWIIRNQTTLPNDVDFNNIVKFLLPAFVPWLVIILFLVFVFRFLKKIF